MWTRIIGRCPKIEESRSFALQASVVGMRQWIRNEKRKASQEIWETSQRRLEMQLSKEHRERRAWTLKDKRARRYIEGESEE